MRFLLVDRILSLVPGERIEAEREVPQDEDYFQDHFPGFPVVPGVLLTESMGQAAAKCLDAQGLARGKAMLARILSATVPISMEKNWGQILAVLAIASMVVGNFVAVAQRDLKRMLAYSGIAHVGYMTIALVTLRDESIAAIAVYTITYALMNIGAFGVVSLLQKSQNEPQTLDDIAGLGFRRPYYGLALAVCMFSLSGLPPTAGFISKFYVFRVAI
jgi:NADH-quinone oxidoreductase subunit N